MTDLLVEQVVHSGSTPVSQAPDSKSPGNGPTSLDALPKLNQVKSGSHEIEIYGANDTNNRVQTENMMTQIIQQRAKMFNREYHE